jgi:hypothetical protein
MAGDWIKVEHATMDKPEVALLSELLGVPVAHGFGVLVMFWMWCDKHSRNGVVTPASRMSIDTVTHTPGFSAALESVGWGAFDEAARTLTLPNFVRHNETSAKTRALGQKRASKFRNAEVTHERYETVTREEKRREDIKPKPKTSAQPSAAPQGVRAEVWEEWRKARGKKLTAYAVTLQAKQLAEWGGDPNAIIEQSIRNGWAGLFPLKQAPPPSRSDARMDVADAIFKRGKYAVGPQDRDITGVAERVD